MNNEKNEEIWIHTQNPRRFPGFTVVVVTLFFEILDDFHDFVSECVSLPRKINNPCFCVSPFFRRKVAIFIRRETKTHILPTKINEHIGIHVSIHDQYYNAVHKFDMALSVFGRVRMSLSRVMRVLVARQTLLTWEQGLSSQSSPDL